MRRLLWIAFALTAPWAAGWGSVGHRTIGEIASRHLSPETQAWVSVLLSEAGSGEVTLASVSTWADRVRNDEEWEYTAPWHYVNLPRSPEATYDAARDCVGGNCVVAAITKCRDIVSGTLATTEITRTEALMFLVHFAGDLHQPLHASYAEDRGGNDIAVTFFGDDINLHSLWDSGMIFRTGREYEEYADLLNSRLIPEEKRDWADTDPVLWANESFALAVSNAYAIPDDHVLGEEYYERNLPVIEVRLLQAGVRLAAMLNAITAQSAIQGGIVLSAGQHRSP